MPLYAYIGGTNAKVLPVPMMNIINGGAHASNNVDIQEFMIMPVGAESFAEALRWCSEVFHNLKKVLSEMGMTTAVGDEGGFAPNLEKDEDAIKVILTAVKKQDISRVSSSESIDAASSEWYQKDGRTCCPRPKTMSKAELVKYWQDRPRNTRLSLEDGVAEDDWEAWKMPDAIGGKVQQWATICSLPMWALVTASGVRARF